jgi:hypothetical protein
VQVFVSGQLSTDDDGLADDGGTLYELHALRFSFEISRFVSRWVLPELYASPCREANQ